MKNFILQLGLQFSISEKQKCISVAHRIVILADIANEYGVLALENEIIEDNNFTKIGVNLILDGVRPELIEKIFQYYIMSSQYTGSELLEKLIISQGLLAINEGCNPSVVAHILGAMLGENYLSKILVERNKIVNLNLNSYIDKYTSKLTESIVFEEKLINLKRSELAYVLMPIENNIIAMALKGCSKLFISHIRDGVSENSYIEICKMFKLLNLNKEEVLEHQGIILLNLEKLKLSGVIIETDN